MENTRNSDQKFEREREDIEERHRNEILNLLKSFEFERKDMEARLQEELEKKDNEMQNVQQSEFGRKDMQARLEEELEKKDSEMQNIQESNIDNERSFSNEAKSGLQTEFEKEKEKLLIKITHLEEELKKKGTEVRLSTQNQGQDRLESEKINQSQNTLDEMQNSESNTKEMKSLSELETENRKLQADLNKSRDEIFKLKSHVKDLTQKLQDIEKLFQDGDIPSDKKDILSQILQGTTRDISSSHNVVESPSNSPEAHEKSFDDIDTSFTANKPHRTNSVLSFQLEELNLENEDLKRSVYELEQKLRRTVEENEMKVHVFNEKLNELVEKIMTGDSSETTKESGFKINLVEEINNVRLEKAPNELLEEYVSIVLRQKLTAPSPDILDVNFCHELQSLEQILDIEIFDGRVFDSEMKDEVKQVLRDKERELLVAYTLEKLRDEIRHRATTEGTLEELQKERERDFCVHQAVNEVLKEHLGIPDDKVGHEKGENPAVNGVSKVHLGTSSDDNQAANKVLREHLGIMNEDDKVVHSSSLEDNEVDRMQNQSSCIDVESLKAEKENLERNLQELQEYFEKERQAWLEKLQSPLQGDSKDPEDKDKVIQSLQAQKVLMEEILNTERFHLSRLYYMEMKEELETCLKEHQFDRSTRLDKERFVDAWKHHAEVGELYQEILSKETENLQNLQTNSKGKNTPKNDGDLQNDSPRDEINNERSRLEQQLPVKLELLELQRRRCRDHKAASLILEQAVVALETAAQEQDTLLVGGDYLRRKSSWSSIEEETESPDVRKEVSPQEVSLYEEETDNKDVPSPNSSTELVGNPSRKDGLADALVKVFERLLNAQQGSNDPQLDSCASDSELSEVETSSTQDVPSDDEGSTKNQDSENLEDASSTNSSPRPTEPKPEDPEGHPETDDNTSVPVIFKLPPRIENILNIERFNMSRLLRDEYIDKIRRGREKLRRVRAKKEQKNGEMVSKFQDEVRALLEDVEFGESGREEKIPPRQRQKLTATPSYDSGIVDPVERDKEDVVKKYKELLEKARRDLNRAHRALKARNSGRGEVMDEIAAMKRSSKEAKNDLDELEGKRSDLDHERGVLLGKIKDAQNSANTNDERQGTENEMVQKDMDKHTEELENKIKKLCEEKVAAEEEVKELQRKLVAGTGGEDILKDLQEKLTDVNDKKSRLDEKCAELESEKLEKDERFETAMKGKEQEVSELQKKLVAGTGAEDILKELQGNLEKAKDEKLEVEEKCSGLEKAIKEKEEELSKSKEETEALERKSVEGTGAEEIVEKLQGKLNETKAEKATVEERCHELEHEIEKKNKELTNVKEHQQQEVNELQRKLVAGTGGEDILKDLQEKLQETKEQNSSVEQNNSDLQKEIERKEKALCDEKKKMEAEINYLQTKLVAGTGGEEILKELQEKKQEAENQKCSLEERNVELEKEIERKEKASGDEENMMREEINDLQRKMVAGTGGEEILKDLQDNLQEAKEKNSSLEQRNSELQRGIKENEKTFSDNEKKMEDEINDLQRKLVAGTGGEEILAELQDTLRQAKEDKAALQIKYEELGDKGNEKNKELSNEIKEKESEINELQKKLVSGTGGEEILTELQDKLEKSKEENVALQTKCEELEGKAKASDKEFEDEIKRKENEIIDLQKNLVSGTGGEEIVAELQDKLERGKEENSALQTKCDKLEDTVKARYKEYIDEIKEKDNEISDLQKKLVSGTGEEEILSEIQDKLERGNEEKTALQTKCEDLEDKAKAKDKDFGKEIKERDTKINELQKKLVSGTGGEEILAELQDELAMEKEENTILQTKCEDLEDSAKTKDEEFSKEIRQKDNEINDLQKKLMSGTGGEEILTELQDKLERGKEENAALQTKCGGLEDRAKAKEEEFSKEIKEKDNEINDLQKKLVSGTGGDEILAELQDKLERGKEEKTALQTKCEDLEDKAKAKDEEFGKEIKERDTRINELQKKLVSGTGREEILAELQDELARGKEENIIVRTKCEDLEDRAKANDEEFSKEIKERDTKINELQKKLVSGTGGEEILTELQDELARGKEENTILQTKCEDLEDRAKTKDEEFSKETKEKDNEINDLQKKLVSGTGGEEILTELQDKLERGKEENAALQTKCEGLEDRAKAKEEEFSKEIKEKDDEISDLQKKLVSGSGGEEILAELQEKLEREKEEKTTLQTKCEDLEDRAKAKDEHFSKEIKEKDNEINDLQKKLVSGTGGEEILAELQDKLERGKEEKIALKTKCEDLEDKAKTKDKEFGKEIKERDTRINEFQKKLVSGTGGEEILAELQDELARGKEENIILQTKCEDLQDRAKANDDEFRKEIKEKNNEISDLQKKLVSGTGGEEILAELQDKLENAKKKKDALQTKCEEFEDKAKAKNKEFSDEIREKDNEISDLQKKLVSGTGGEEIVAELQDKLERGKEENAALQTKCDKLEDTVKARDKEYIDEIKEKDNEICDLQKRLVSGSGGEEILAELQDKLEREKEEKTTLQTKCEDLQYRAKAKDEQFSKEIKENDNEINDLQKKLVSGTGGEEILAELQDKLENAKKEKDSVQTKYEDLEDRAKAKDEEFSKEIKEKDHEIRDLQKKLVNGTGGEEILAELRDKLQNATKEKDTLQTKYENLQDKAKAKYREFSDEIKEKDNEISDLQKKLVSGTGGDEILAELQDKLERGKEEKTALQTKCEDLEDKAKAKDEDFGKEIKGKDTQINELQKKLVSGTGGEEIVAELQDELARGKEESTILQTKCEDLEDRAKTKDEQFSKEIKEKDNEISDLQKKLVSGTGGEEILAELQDKLERGNKENAALQTKCDKLEDTVKARDKKYIDEIKEKDNEISDLQKKLVSGTGGDKILAELQDKLENAKKEKDALQTNCEDLEDRAKAKDEEFSKEIKEKDNELSDLQKKLVSGTGGEEILAELQDKLERGKVENTTLQTKCEGLEGKAKARDKEFGQEIKERDTRINELQKKLVSGTGGEEIVAELQDKLASGKEEKTILQTRCEDLEDRAKTKDEQFSKDIEEKDNAINDLQKKLVSGTGGEEILVELQDKLENTKKENDALKTNCEDLEDRAKAKEEEFSKEIKEKDNEIRDLQKKLVSGTGGEEILAELQDKLEDATKEKDSLHRKCADLEDKAKGKDLEFSDEIKEKDGEISDLQKKLISGTGGEKILAELQDKLGSGKEEKTALQTRCEDLEDKAKAKDKELDKEIKERDIRINELQKKLVSGTGGEEILAELRDELKEVKHENAVLQAQCSGDENKAAAREKGLEDEMKVKEYEIENLQRQLVSGTGCEEMLNELQDKLKITKEENAGLQEECSQLEECLVAKDKEFDGKIKQKDADIFELQRKLVSGSGGKEVLLDLQNKLKDTYEEKGLLEERCLELAGEVKLKDKELFNQKKENAEEVNDLQKKLIAGTGSEEVLQELQNKLKETEMEKEMMVEKCLILKDEVEKKDMEAKEEKAKRDEEVNKLQKKLLSGTGGEEVLEELQEKLKEAEMGMGILKEKYSKLENEIEKKDMEAKKENTKRDEEVNKLQKKLISGTGGEEILEELQEKLKGAEKEKQKLERTCAELDGDIEKKDKQLQRKDEEVNDLQKKIVAGTGGEDLLGELQENLRDAKKSEKALEKRCSVFEKDLQEKDDGNKNKQNEIEELQRKLLSGTGGEEVLLDLQEKLNEAGKEKTMLESELAELETDSEEINAKFAKQLNDKQEEINKLQRDLVEGTEAEEVVADLQEKLAVANKETKTLEAKCHELEKCKRQKNLDRDDGKELKRLQVANKVLENENEAKQDKINELQFKMIQGTGGEDVLKDLQNDLSEANEKNKELEIRNAELEHGRDGLDEYGEGNIAAVLKEENERLEANNDKMVEKLENLQKNIVNGTGSEELLQELQNEIKELSSENSELRKEKREKEATDRGGKDVKQLEKDLNKAKLERKHLISDNESKDEEIADLQKKLVAGSGGEELLGDLQQEIKALKDANKNMAIQCHDVEEMNKDMIDEKEKYKKQEKGLFRAKMENEKVAEENEAKDKEICELQRLIVDGSGAEELLKTLQDKIKETTEDNKALEKKCSDLESDTVGLAEDTERLQQRVIDLAEAENEIERLSQDCEEKERQIVELQRKLVAGTGCEEMLEDLQNKVKNLQEKNNDHEGKLAKSRKDAIVLEGLEKKNKGRKNERKVPDRFGHVGTDDNSTEGSFDIRKLKSKDVSSRDQEFVGLSHRDGTEVADEDINEPLTYEKCLQMIPEIKEEKDYWKEKYKALRMKVGGQFVDIIPDVWNNETTLEKEREEILSQLSKLRQKITERETPVVKTVSEQDRIETELSGVEDDLEVCSGNLEQLHEMQNEQNVIGKNEGKLMECLHQLGLKTDSLVESDSKEGKSSDIPMIRDGSDIEALERKLEQLYNEVEELLTEEQNLKDREKDISCLVDDKINTENEIQEIEAAIQNLQKGLSTQNDLNPSYSSFNRNLEDATNPESEGINNELEKIQHEINILQSSFETPNSSSGQEVNNLLDLMKEKSKLEDELTDTEKSLNQLGNREYETLVKERETHEKVAKKLLELSREREVTEGELQELEALAQEKESQLQKSFNTELTSKEASDTSTKKRRGFRKRKSSSGVKSEDPGSISSAEEGFSEIDLGEPPLSSDAALALSEELGSLIQKKSSLAVRLEGLGKEITAQSLKVEKSLIGVKDDPSAEPSLGAGYVSVEDLTQSQMSIFDDYNMVDELSLATGIVREERVKRKSSRKAPMSKLLKEKSALEKKLKESQGKVLVQNTKVKNALKEEKDARKAKEKFVQAAQDRKAVENDLSNVCSKIDELASEEGSVKEKKAKTPKGRKSMSKNDKRRLLSQRESLGKQLDTIKKKIENFSLDEEDAELADFPEMKEAGNIGNTVERLRELLAREAELKQELNRLTSKELLSESSGSGMISDYGSSDEGAGGMLDNGGELGKRDDKDRHMKDFGETSDSGALDESFDNKGMLKEMFRDVGNQVKSLSTAKEEQETEATPPTTQTEDTSNTTIDYGKASLLEKGAQNRTNPSVLPQTQYSKDTMLSSEKDGKMVADRSAPYSEVMELLLKEKAKKEAKLSGLENEIENEESGDDKTKDADLVSQRKREDLKNKMKLALNELQQRKEALGESKNVLRNSTKGSSEDPEQVLDDSRIALTQQKDKLEADLVAVKDELDKQTQSGESLDDISADYQVYKDIKRKEKDLVAALDKVNDKLHKRKDWSAMDNPGEKNDTNLGETYADILKRMTEENLNMADLIHELEETKETLSKEREITIELLDLIKSRVGNELLEALMGEGLQSPSIEIREIGMFGGEEYPELFDEVENDTVTVAAIIDDYKKVNQFLFKENQKLHEKIELLKAKVDEDLFSSIVDQDSTADIEISKKHEISKILENNKTLFEQIVSNTESQNEELQSLRVELEGVRKADKENKESDLSKMKEKVEDISIELDEARKRREELVHKLKDMENDLNCSNETFEIAGEEHGHSTAVVDSSLNGSNESQNQANSTKKMDKSIENKRELKKLSATKEDVGSSSDRLNEIQNLAESTKEKDESKQKDKDNILQEARSSLEEAEELGDRVDIELERLSTELVQTETPEAGIPKVNSVKQSDGLGSELNKEYGNEDFGSGNGRGYNEDDRQYRKDNGGYSEDGQESDEDDKQDNEGLNEKMSRVENLQKAFVAKLDEVQKLQEKFKRNLEDSVRDEIEIQNESLKDKLANLEIENEELVSKLQKVEAMNEELRNNLELSKEACDENTELKAKTQSLEKEIEETIAKLNETRKERDEVIEEFENLQKENKNIEEHSSSAGNENSELKEKMADLQNDKEELATNLNESNKARNEIAVELKNLQEEVEALKETSSLLEKANDEMKEKIRDLENENERITAKLNEANEDNKEIAKDVEDLEKENKSLEDLLDAQRKENHELEEKIQCGKDELLVKLNEADRIRQEVVEDLGNYEENNKSLQEKIGTLENENKELNEVIRALKNENEEGIVKLNEIKETIKDNEEKLESLNDLAQENESLKERLGYLENENKKLKDEIQENESIKETLASLENENNEIIPKMERLEKLNKELEDEIEYLRKEEKDFESLNEKLKANEFARENIREELGDLRNDMEEVEDFVRENLRQDTGNGVISALEKCKENCEKNGKQNNLLKAEVEKMEKIQNVVGDNLSEKLLELSKEGMILNDTQEIPKCVEGLVKDKNTLASVLNEYENDLDKVKQHLGESLFSLVVGKDAGLNGEENDQRLKMAEELRCGRHIEDVVREYEDLINSHASDTETVEHLQVKVNVLGQELEALGKQRDGVLVEDDRPKTSSGDDLRNQNESDVENGGLDGRENSGESVKLSEAAPVANAEGGDQILKSSQEYQNDSLMDIEYEDLLKKVMDHQAEIEEAEQLLRVQRAKHEADKQKMIEQVNAEKSNMQQLINNERASMEKAMQNLINEIVRLKEERNEIRKNNRIEKEKLVLAFENERTELLSSYEEMKNEIEGKLEKKFQDDLEKVKKEMEAREVELKEELMKFKTERNNLASKVAEMEDKIGNEITGSEKNEKLWLSNEKESKEQIKNEFEEKMKVEKKRFQETLNSLRQEIERLQKERSKAMNEISTQQGDSLKQTTDISASEAVIYDRLESEFRTKMNSEKMFMESRIKELRKENEVLNHQKQELKSGMRMERLELSKKYEREKEELAEKYRNELRTLRKNLEKTQTSHEASTVPTQNFYELRRKIRDRDTKLKRYETFFKELNQEASILQRDSDLAV